MASYKSGSLIMVALITIAVILTSYESEARYLPTRSNGERIDKLRELLKEVSKMYKLLESELEKEEISEIPRWHPESKLFYKREASLNIPQPAQ